MEKDCIYCGTNFTAIRSSKKYCSDNCKQMAYFKRNGLILSGVAETSNLKYEKPVIAKSEIRTPNVQPIVKEKKQTFKKEIVKSDPVRIDDNNMLETIISRLSIAMERKMEQAIEKVKQELNSKYESLIVKSNLTINDKIDEPAKQLCASVSYTEAIRPIREHKSKINYCNPCERLIVKCENPKRNAINFKTENQQKHFTISEIKEPALINTTAENNNSILNTENSNTDQQEKNEREKNVNKNLHQIQILELADDEYNEQEFDELEHEEEFEEVEEQEQEEEDTEEQQEKDNNTETIQKQESDHKIIKLITELENKNPIALERHEEEEPEYKWMESKFIRSIEKNYLNNNEYLFKDPSEHWSINQAKTVNWITVRIRCLVESMIKLSNYNRIDAHTLFCITDAFNRLVKSNAFKNLPDNYPYTELIKELCIKLNRIVQQNKYSELLKFNLSAELKSKLISIRYEMLNYFPATKFSEMDFAEEINSFKKNSKADNEDDLDENMEDENEERSGTKKAWRIKYESMKRQQLRNAA